MVVMKFGGTSVADASALARLTAIVSAHRRTHPGEPILVVVSALAGVTDQLLDIATRAEAGQREAVERAVGELARRHDAMIDALVPLSADGPAAATAVRAAVREDFDRLRQMAGALSLLGEVSPRSRDAIAATGELASSRAVQFALAARGIPSAWVDARQVLVTSAGFGAAVPDAHATRAAAATFVAPRLAEGLVVVVGGYVGATPAGVTTTLGRGGSDYSAALFGAALGARVIQIWTDVDGMLTADPRVLDEADLVETLSFGEAAELAYFGAKVLHPSTILPAVEHDIPVLILNARHPERRGSRIVATSIPGTPGLTAIATKRGVTRIDVSSTRMLMAYGFLSRVFAVFERHRTSVDVVTTSEVTVSVTVDDTRALDAIVADLGEFSEVVVEPGMAIVAAVGDELQRDPTLAARVLGALEGLRVAMVSQGGSRRNITFVLPDTEAPTAVRRLHAHRRTLRSPAPVAAPAEAGAPAPATPDVPSRP